MIFRNERVGYRAHDNRDNPRSQSEREREREREREGEEEGEPAVKNSSARVALATLISRADVISAISADPPICRSDLRAARSCIVNAKHRYIAMKLLTRPSIPSASSRRIRFIAPQLIHESPLVSPLRKIIGILATIVSVRAGVRRSLERTFLPFPRQGCRSADSPTAPSNASERVGRFVLVKSESPSRDRCRVPVYFDIY